MRRDEATAGWGGEGAEGAVVEMDAEEKLVGPGTVAIKDKVVAQRLAWWEVGNFELQGEQAQQWRLQICVGEWGWCGRGNRCVHSIIVAMRCNQRVWSTSIMGC